VIRVLYLHPPPIHFKPSGPNDHVSSFKAHRGLCVARGVTGRTFPQRLVRAGREFVVWADTTQISPVRKDSHFQGGIEPRTRGFSGVSRRFPEFINQSLAALSTPLPDTPRRNPGTLNLSWSQIRHSTFATGWLSTERALAQNAAAPPRIPRAPILSMRADRAYNHLPTDATQRSSVIL
jgi:hypothetical protein